ncbi:hypothetical protein [Streptomyces sp. NPDC002221]|uniref:hypothetical protein n=1 Tax=Streptomyces sp. NPDC002221 TaxID=3364639 RepID=UPI00367A52A1
MARASHCPQCGAALIPPRVRGEGPWNTGWRQGLDPKEQFIKYGKDHEADVRCPCGTIVELQYGPLSALQIAERERIYGAMVWLFYAVEAHVGQRLRLGLRPGRDLVNFHWRSPRTTIGACQRTYYLDLGESASADGLHLLLEPRTTYPRAGRVLVGNGLLYTAEAFHNWMAHGIALTPWTPTEGGADLAA